MIKITKFLFEHINPKLNTYYINGLTESYKFKERKPESQEFIYKFIAALKNLPNY